VQWRRGRLVLRGTSRWRSVESISSDLWNVDEIWL
jgi:hypothetical protein